MKNKITKIIVAVVLPLLSIIFPMATFAANNTDDPCKKDVCNSSCKVPQAVKDAAGCSSNVTADPLPTVIQKILNAIIGVLGIVAVIFIIVGGVNYMTSAGDSAKAKKAKDTILYAVIGLVVCVLAFAIVNFVIGTILKNAP